MLVRGEVNIRDPYVLLDKGKYYLYGTRSETCWGEAYGFDVFVSDDLESFEGPIEIFSRPEGFFATSNYWAPECYFYKGEYYLLTTFGAEDMLKGVYILKSESPMGPFKPYSKRLTPNDWCAIDGSLYFEDDKPNLIFSHSFEDGNLDGEYCIVGLREDLKEALDERPKTLFCAKDAKWARPVPFAKAEFGIEDDMYFSDGPSLLKTDEGKLFMAFSSWSEKGYAVGCAKSLSGKVNGEWILDEEPIYPENGGHGMFFRDKVGKVRFTLHGPNDKYMERPLFFDVTIKGDKLKLDL